MFLLAVLLLGGASPVFAQKITGDITGTVTDPSGAVVPGATVTAENVGTGLSRSAKTAATGDYRLVELPPGTYKVTVSATGFKTVVGDVQVAIGIITHADFSLQVGERTETVTVEAVAALIETEENRQNTLIDSRRIEDLPLSGRDFNSLLQVVPGVQRAPGGGFLTVNINGLRRTSNNFAVDGIPNNDRYYGDSALNQVAIAGTAATLVPLEGISEFSVQSNPGGEYGIKGGSVINVGLRGGTNDFHGQVFWFRHTDVTDARNFFSEEATPFRLNQVGAVVGGPIVKNKTFFYASYQAFRLKDFFPYTADVPTPGEVAAALACVTTGAGCLIPGLAIPGPGDDMIFGTGDDGTPNTIGLNLLSFYPINPAGFVFVSAPNTLKVDGFHIKIDHVFNERHNLSAKYIFGDSEQSQPAFSGTLVPPSPNPADMFNSVSPTRSQLFGLGWVWNISTDKILESRAGMTRFSQLIDVNNKVNPLDLGINTGPLSPADFGVPAVYYLGYFGYIGGVGGYPITTRPNQTYDWQEHFTWLRGKHTLKFGGQYQHAYTNSVRTRARGELDVAFTGNHVLALQQLLLGFWDGASRFFGDSTRHIFQDSVGFYAQDTWKIHPHVTLQLGVRYDVSGALGEERDQCANFLPGDPMAGPEGFVLCSDRPLYGVDKNNFGPRVGVAWDVTGRGKTVLRGGYTLNYDIPNFGSIHAPRTGFVGGSRAGAFTQIPQGNFGVQISTTPPANQALFAGNAFCAVFLCVSPGVPIYGPNVLPDPPFNVFSVVPNLKTPMVHLYNLTFQQEVTKQSVFTLAYVGSHGESLLIYRDANASPLGCAAITDNPPVGLTPNDTCIPFARPLAAALPDIEHVIELTNASWSWFDSLQASFQMRNWRGLTGQTNFTWANSRDTGSNNRSDRDDFTQLNNPFTIRNMYGPSEHDVRLNFNLSLVYDAPTIPNIPRLLGEGWQFNSYYQALTGRPFTPLYTASSDPVRDPSGQGGVGSIRANCNGTPIYNPGDPDNYITNPGIFSKPLPGTVGTCGRNTLRAPGLSQWDLGVFKNTRFKERYTIQFRWEVFNILNRTNFSYAPTNSIRSGSFGTLRETSDVFALNAVLGQGAARSMQFGIKFIF